MKKIIDILAVISVVIGAVFVLVATVVIMGAIDGFMFYKVWQWIVVPIFNTSPLNFITCLAIALSINLLFKPFGGKIKDEYQDEQSNKFSNIVIGKLVILGAIYILTRFI